MLLPKVPLSANVGSNSKMSIKSCLLYQLDKLDQIIPILKIVLILFSGKMRRKWVLEPEKNIRKLKEQSVTWIYIPRWRLMSVPENVSFYDIQTSLFGLLYKIRPHLQSPENPTQNKKLAINDKTHEREKKKIEQPLMKILNEQWVNHIGVSDTSGVLLG